MNVWMSMAWIGWLVLAPTIHGRSEGDDLSGTSIVDKSSKPKTAATNKTAISRPQTLAANKPRKVEIIAHRGASHDAPENTLPSLELAWKQNSDASEFDVFLTADKRIVVIHDKDTKRTAGKPNLKIVESKLEELRKLDVGKWKGPRFAGTRIPTLEEMLAGVPKGKTAFIEVKCGKEIVPELARVLDACKLVPNQIVVIAFDPNVIAELKRVRPKTRAYLLIDFKKTHGNERTAEYMIAKAREVKADGLDLGALPDIDAAFVQKVHAAGMKLYVWTVDDPSDARRLAKAGVDGITTNRPQFLRDQLPLTPVFSLRKAKSKAATATKTKVDRKSK